MIIPGLEDGQTGVWIALRNVYRCGSSVPELQDQAFIGSGRYAP